jgi:CO/xanthine dehydrogenase Mo-binding subunit
MSFALVGNPDVTRRDIPSKVTGKLVYTYDINPEHLGLEPDQMLYMGVLRCPYPHANVTKLDTSAAEAAGYITLTADDFAEYNLMFVGSGQPHPPITNNVLYSGQPVCAVAAPTTDEVEDAISLINVEYDVLPFVLDVEQALQPGAVQLFPSGNLPMGAINPENDVFTAATIRYAFGDVDSAIASADVVVGSPDPIELNTQVHQQAEMEPWAVVANWTNGGLTVYDTTEAPFLGQATIASYFNLPINNVRVVGSGIPGVGASGFAGMTMGNKLGNAEHVIITVMMSKKAGAAVKYGPTRSDHLAITSQRFSERAYLTFAGNSDGTLTAIKGLIYENSGSYGGANGSDTISDFMNMYIVPNMDISLIPVNTNTHNRSGAFRNVGESQGHFFLESMADMLSEKMNIDPTKFRLINMRGQTTATRVDPTEGLPYTGFGNPENFVDAMNTFGWSSVWKGWGVPSSVNGPVRVGVGFALHNGAKGSPFGPSSVMITISQNGSVFVNSGRTDNGAGSDTAIPIIAAEALGLTSLANFTYLHADTALTTNDGIQGGSTSTRTSGLSTLLAVEDLKGQWTPMIASKLGVPASSLVFGNNTIYQNGNPSVSISFTDAAAMLPAPITGTGNGIAAVPYGNVSFRVGGGKFATVAVDTETAEVRVLNATVGIGIGRVIFRKGADSQLRGGFIQGIGEALFEEYDNDPTTGQIINYNYHDFRLPTQADSPDSITSVWGEYVDPVGPFGAVGIGENCSMAVSAAIANALSNAMGGYRFNTLPITKMDIVAGIQWMQANGKL